MKSVIKVILMCFISFTAVSAYAAPVNGSLIVGGLLDIGEGVTLDAATYITLSTVTGTAGTGDIDDVFGLVGAGGSASLSSFAPVSNFMNIDDWSFDLATLSIVGTPTAGLLKLEGTGLLSDASGSYDATWSFSAQTSTSYSMTVTTVVPVPAAVWLFGSGLIGLIGIARRRA